MSILKITKQLEVIPLPIQGPNSLHFSPLQDILQSVSSIPHTLAWIESEIERISAVKPTIGAEPRPYVSKATLPWERPEDGSEVPNNTTQYIHAGLMSYTRSDSLLCHPSL